MTIMSAPRNIQSLAIQEITCSQNK